MHRNERGDSLICQGIPELIDNWWMRRMRRRRVLILHAHVFGKSIYE